MACACACVVTLGCGGPPVVQGPRDEFVPPPMQAMSNTLHVAVMMSGSFSSSAQSAEDPSYFDVRLHIVPIWTDRADGPWLYLEQATVEEASTPYRQRIYRLVDHGAGRVEGIVFEFSGSPAAYVGAWKDPARLNALDPSLLLPRMGCSVLLHPEGPDRFVSRVRGDACHSDLRGAASESSEFTLTPGLIETWDRGYDASGQQIWGPRTGPYRFVREDSNAS